jgi:hypothetical protein
MKTKYFYSMTFTLVVLLLLSFSCSKPPYKPPYNNIKGFVIGKESCNTDETKDYWLIDMTLGSNITQVGDTLVLNSVTYTNVLKTKDLAQQLKQIGLRVSIDYKTISTNKIQTTGCNIVTPTTYLLREIFIINQGEIR